MPIAAITAAALGLLALLLVFARRESFPGVLAAKTSLSALFVLAALAGPHGQAVYSTLVFAGLLCGLAGDVLLAIPSRRAFLGGLVSFLAGHLFYVAAFFSLAAPGPLTGLAAALVIPAGAAVFLRLRPHLGKMMPAVLAYVGVISIMLVGAATVMGEEGLALPGRSLALAGAVLFYLSDLLVARNRFVKKEFVNRLFGLPLYYAGQFMIAFSTWLL